MTKNLVYTLTSPSIPITSTTMFCLTFDYWSYLREHGSLRLTTLINGIFRNNWESQSNYGWYPVAISIEMPDDFKVNIYSNKVRLFLIYQKQTNQSMVKSKSPK